MTSASFSAAFLGHVLEVAREAARRGGDIAHARIQAQGEYFRWKRSRDPFVSQSLAVQAAIVETIKVSFPDAAILAEEGPDDEEMPVGADPLWIVDPICGSLNYMHHDPDYAVTIGYLQDGAWKVGVVYEPEREAMWTGIDGQGAWLNDQRIVVDQFADGTEAWQAAAIGIDWPGSVEARREMLSVVSTILPVVTALRVIGSPGLGLCYVAAGRLHGYSALDLRPWDVAPAAVILQSAGGILTNFGGSSWYHSPDGGYVASNGIIHGRLLQSSQAIIALRRMAADRAARLAQGAQQPQQPPTSS